MTTISIYDHLTGETIVRDLTAEEIADIETQAAIEAAKAAEIEVVNAAKAEAKQSAETKLAALGLTADEIVALLS